MGPVRPTSVSEPALDGYESLELTPRARQISDALAESLPANRKQAIEILVKSIGPENEADALTGMERFRYMPHIFFVADHGLDHFEAAIEAQYELTKRFTAEFSIRAYLERFPERTLARLREWTTDPNFHVRRLVSEGTRPRLPWAPRLKQFQEDPSPVIELLDLLKDDPEEYVRRSVANNLNDIAKDHPDLVVEIAQRWWVGTDRNRERLIKHGLRSLIKSGHPGALAVLGFHPGSPVRVKRVTIEPKTLKIGESVRIVVELANDSDTAGEALLDLIVHFVKADGATRPKVFKGGERSVAGGGTATIAKSISLAQRTTRTHYPGQHKVDVQINGLASSAGFFMVKEH